VRREIFLVGSIRSKTIALVYDCYCHSRGPRPTHRPWTTEQNSGQELRPVSPLRGLEGDDVVVCRAPEQSLSLRVGVCRPRCARLALRRPTLGLLRMAPREARPNRHEGDQIERRREQPRRRLERTVRRGFTLS
jgi:hypothetical protein